MPQNEPAFGVRGQRDRCNHELAIGKKERGRVGPPHDRMPGAVEDQITKQIVVTNTHLLIRAILLVHQPGNGSRLPE